MIKSAFPFRVLAYLDLDLPSRDTFLLFPPPINFVARGDRSSRDPRSSQLCPRAPTTRSAWSEKGSLFRISFIRKAVFREMEIIRILTEYSRRRISTNRSPRFTSEKNYQLDDQWRSRKAFSREWNDSFGCTAGTSFRNRDGVYRNKGMAISGKLALCSMVRSINNGTGGGEIQIRTRERVFTPQLFYRRVYVLSRRCSFHARQSRDYARTSAYVRTVSTPSPRQNPFFHGWNMWEGEGADRLAG